MTAARGGESVRDVTLTADALPHSYLEEGLDFEVTGYGLDGAEPEGPVDGTIDLAHRSDWTDLEVSVSLTVADGVLDSVLPEEERDSPPLRLVLAAWCKEAIRRERLILAEAPLEPGTYEGRFTINRETVRGRVHLQPFLVRADDRTGSSRYAARAGRRVASADPFTIQVDPRRSVQGMLRPIWESFERRNEEGGDFPPSENHLHYLDLRDSESPRLYLNMDHETVAEALRPGGDGANTEIAEAVFDQIERDVWPQLLFRTAGDVDQAGEPEHEWQADVLDEFLDVLYPSIDGDGEAALRLREDLSDPQSAWPLIARLSEEIDDRIDLPDRTNRLLGELTEEDS